MNKNTIIGIVLMVVLFIGYSIYQVNVKEQQDEQRAKYDQVQAKKKPETAEKETARLAEEAMTPEQKEERDARIAADAEKICDSTVEDCNGIDDRG